MAKLPNPYGVLDPFSHGTGVKIKPTTAPFYFQSHEYPVRRFMADGGEVSPDVIDHLESLGRGGDTLLAHINPHEAAFLHALGGSGNVNPHTGLLEFDYNSGDNGGGNSGDSGNNGPDSGGGGWSSGMASQYGGKDPAGGSYGYWSGPGGASSIGSGPSNAPSDWGNLMASDYAAAGYPDIGFSVANTNPFSGFSTADINNIAQGISPASNQVAATPTYSPSPVISSPLPAQMPAPTVSAPPAATLDTMPATTAPPASAQPDQAQAAPDALGTLAAGLLAQRGAPEPAPDTAPAAADTAPPASNVSIGPDYTTVAPHSNFAISDIGAQDAADAGLFSSTPAAQYTDGLLGNVSPNAWSSFPAAPTFSLPGQTMTAQAPDPSIGNWDFAGGLQNMPAPSNIGAATGYIGGFSPTQMSEDQPATLGGMSFPEEATLGSPNPTYVGPLNADPRGTDLQTNFSSDTTPNYASIPSIPGYDSMTAAQRATALLDATQGLPSYGYIGAPGIGAMLNNIQRETIGTFDPTILGDHRNSYGLFQENKQRANDMATALGDQIGNPVAQMAYALHEMQTPDGITSTPQQMANAYGAIANAQQGDVPDASVAFTRNFERPNLNNPAIAAAMNNTANYGLGTQLTGGIPANVPTPPSRPVNLNSIAPDQGFPGNAMDAAQQDLNDPNSPINQIASQIPSDYQGSVLALPVAALLLAKGMGYDPLGLGNLGSKVGSLFGGSDNYGDTAYTNHTGVGINGSPGGAPQSFNSNIGGGNSGNSNVVPYSPLLAAAVAAANAPKSSTASTTPAAATPTTSHGLYDTNYHQTLNPLSIDWAHYGAGPEPAFYTYG